jgi:hypothetical protein
LTHVTARASGGGYPIGVYNIGGDSILTRVTMNSSNSSAGAAFYNVFGSPTLVSASATAGQRAVVNDRGNVTIRSSVLSGGTAGISASTDNGSGSFLVTVDGSSVYGGTNSIDAASATGSTMTVLVGASQLAGGPVTGSGTVRCVGVYDANYNSPGYTTCP